MYRYILQMLAKEMPHAKFVLPTAPIQPVTLNGGMRMNSWYDIVGLDERSNESCRGIEQSRDLLAGILRQEHETTGLPYNRMVLAGFSQVIKEYGAENVCVRVLWRLGARRLLNRSFLDVL